MIPTSLDIESSAPKLGRSKIIQPFDEALFSLRDRHYSRPPSPMEAGKLGIRYVEGKPLGPRASTVEDLFSGAGEFYAMLWKAQQGVLTTYLHGEGIYFFGEDYLCPQGVKHFRVRNFDLHDLPSGKEIPLRDANRVLGLVEHLWSAPFNNLPSMIREGYLVLPGEEISPMGRADKHDFSIDCSPLKGCRGVRSQERDSHYKIKKEQVPMYEHVLAL